MSATYMKDESGFCYAWTETLAKQKHLTAYNGEVDAGGFATDKASKPAKGVKPPKPTTDDASADPLDAALADAKLDV